MFSVVILFRPLLEKAEIQALIFAWNLPAVLIIFTGRGGAGNPPFPAGRGPRGTGRPSLVCDIALDPCAAPVSVVLLVLVSCADTEWCGLGVQVAGSRRPSGGERTSGGLPCTSVTCRRCNLHTHTGITVLPRGRRRRRRGQELVKSGTPINCIDS